MIVSRPNVAVETRRIIFLLKAIHPSATGVAAPDRSSEGYVSRRRKVNSGGLMPSPACSSRLDRGNIVETATTT